MYKSRLKQWGLRKNYRYEEVNEIIRQEGGVHATASAAKASSSSSSSAVVLGSRVRKTGGRGRGGGGGAGESRRAKGGRRVPGPIEVTDLVAARRQQLTPPPSIIYPPGVFPPPPSGILLCRSQTPPRPPMAMLFPLTPPPELRSSEEAGFHVQRYYAGGFDRGQWAGATQPGWMATNRTVVDWFNRVALARGTLSSGHTKRGFQLLQLCFMEYKEILVTEDPRLMIYTLIGIFLLREYPEVVAMLLKYISNMSRILLGPGHPLHLMWAQLQQMGLQTLMENAKHLFECLVDEFQKNVESDNELLLAITVFGVRNLVLAGLMDVGSAERQLLSMPSKGDNGRIPMALAQIYGVNGEHAKSLVIIEELIRTSDRVRTRAAAFDSLFLITRMVGNRDDICAASERRIAFCIETFGPNSDWACDAGGDYEGYLREIGETERADRLFTDFGIQVDKITEGVQELQIK